MVYKMAQWISDFNDMNRIITEFFKEYSSNSEDVNEIVKFSEYCLANKEDMKHNLIHDQLVAMLNDKEVLPIAGAGLIIIKPPNPKPVPGRFYGDKIMLSKLIITYTTQCSALTVGSHGVYKLNVITLLQHIQSFKDAKKITKPNDVAWYIVVVFSNILMKIVSGLRDYQMSKIHRESICMNTEKISVSPPYSTDSIAKVRTFLTNLTRSSFVKGMIESAGGKGASDKVEKNRHEFEPIAQQYQHWPNYGNFNGDRQRRRHRPSHHEFGISRRRRF